MVAPLGAVGAGIAATAQGAAKTLAKTVVGPKEDAEKESDDGSDQETRQPKDTQSLDSAAITGADLRDFISWLAGELGVAESLRPGNVRVSSRQVPVTSKDEDKAEPFLNSFPYGDLSRPGFLGGHDFWEGWASWQLVSSTP